jgi:hypothetical protein
MLLAVPACVSGAIVLAMVLLVTGSVARRAVTGAEIPGAVELTEIGLYLSAVLAGALAAAQGQHIRADLLGPACTHARRAGSRRCRTCSAGGVLALTWVSWGRRRSRRRRAGWCAGRSPMPNGGSPRRSRSRSRCCPASSSSACCGWRSIPPAARRDEARSVA